LIKHAEPMSRILNEYSRGHKPGLAQVLDTDQIKLGPMATTLVNDRSTKMLKLQLSVADLLTAPWIEFGQTISSGATIRRARNAACCLRLVPAPIGASTPNSAATTTASPRRKSYQRSYHIVDASWARLPRRSEPFPNGDPPQVHMLRSIKRPEKAAQFLLGIFVGARGRPWWQCDAFVRGVGA
jgi:hypothetical protein